MAEETKPPALPERPHPIASAFFTSHDNACRKYKKGDSDESNVAKIRNSLGWRTRYSSANWYPVSIVPTAPNMTCNKAITFHVRQVFPAERSSIRNCVLEDGKVDPVYGTGNTVWPGSIVLLKYIEKLAHSNHNPLQGKTVADLGAGTAITTIACALFGAELVFCTDGCDHVVSLAASNVESAIRELEGRTDHLSKTCETIEYKGLMREQFEVNDCKAIVRKYLWGDGSMTKELEHNKKSQQFDIILCADCIVPMLYPIEPLVDALDELSNEETIAYLSYEKRYYSKFDPAQEFHRLATLKSLQVEVVSEQELDQMYPAFDIEVWKITRKI